MNAFALEELYKTMRQEVDDVEEARKRSLATLKHTVCGMSRVQLVQFLAHGLIGTVPGMFGRPRTRRPDMAIAQRVK